IFILYNLLFIFFFFFSSRRRHTRSKRDWSSDVCSSDLARSASLLSATGRHYNTSSGGSSGPAFRDPRAHGPGRRARLYLTRGVRTSLQRSRRGRVGG